MIEIYDDIDEMLIITADGIITKDIFDIALEASEEI